MDERLRETLSSMMDDEADELSVRRLLSHSDQHDVRGQWQRWQQIRDLMHEQHSPASAIDVAAGVRAELDGRPESRSENASVVETGRSAWRWPVAAMVAVALVVGFGAGAGWDGDAVSGSRDIASNDAAPALGLPVAEQQVGLQELDDAQLQQMRQFLLEHAQHNSVGAGRGSVGYARLVSAGNHY